MSEMTDMDGKFVAMLEVNCAKLKFTIRGNKTSLGFSSAASIRSLQNCFVSRSRTGSEIGGKCFLSTPDGLWLKDRARGRFGPMPFVSNAPFCEDQVISHNAVDTLFKLREMLPRLADDENGFMPG